MQESRDLLSQSLCLGPQPEEQVEFLVRRHGQDVVDVFYEVALQQERGHLSVRSVAFAHEHFVDVILAAGCRMHGSDHILARVKEPVCGFIVDTVVGGDDEVCELQSFLPGQRLEEPV